MQPEFRLLPAGEQEALRREALEAVLRGEKKSRVAERLGVTRQAVHHWIRKYKLNGPASLAARPRGRRKIRPLLPWQEEQVTGAIRFQPPSRMNMDSACWTKKAIAGFVEQSFGVHLPEWIVSAYLRDWGFASQKEVRRAFEGAPPPLLAPRAERSRGPAVAGKRPLETTAGG